MLRRHLAMAAAATLLGTPVFSQTARSTGSRVVRFGQSAALTGAHSSYGRNVQHGINAAFVAASALEASTGLRFELATLDDAGEGRDCVRNVKSLLDAGVLAVVGLTSGNGAEACLPLFEDGQLAMLGTASGSMGIRAPSAAGAFHVRAGYDAEYKRLLTQVRDTGSGQLAVVNAADMSKLNADTLAAALAAHGIQPRLTLVIEPGKTSLDAVAQQLLAARPDGVLFTVDAAPAAGIIDLMNKARFPGVFYASSLAGQNLVETLAARKQSCVFSVVVPRPNPSVVPVAAQCQRDLALLNSGDAKLGITTLEGYIAGRVAVEAALLAHRSGQLTRRRIRESLAGLQLDLGGYRVTFNGGTQGSRYVDLMALDRYGRLVG